MTYLPVMEAVRRETGLERDRSTLHRWRHKGLKTYLIGGRRVTTLEDVRNFVRSDSDLPSATKRTGRSPAKRQRDLQRAQRQLAKEGV